MTKIVAILSGVFVVFAVIQCS